MTWGHCGDAKFCSLEALPHTMLSIYSTNMSDDTRSNACCCCQEFDYGCHDLSKVVPAASGKLPCHMALTVDPCPGQTRVATAWLGRGQANGRLHLKPWLSSLLACKQCMLPIAVTNFNVYAVCMTSVSMISVDRWLTCATRVC